MPLDTESEKVFYDFCRSHRLSIEKIETRQGYRTPDFKVITPTGYKIIVEVTALDEQPRLAEGECHHLVVGAAIRTKLRDKRGQVRRYAEAYSTLIVIGSGLRYRAELDPHCFDAALYGTRAVGVSVPRDVRLPARFDENAHNAGGRFFGRDFNTSVSAAASLSGRPQVLRVYHNRFARRPLDAARLSIGGDRIEHYWKSDCVGWDGPGVR